jgi:hypothetical protein
MKTAVICFFNAFPPRSGSGVVIYDFFKSWPSHRKNLFQMSDLFLKNKNIQNIRLFYNKPIFKIIALPVLIFKLIKYFDNSKKKILIVEGASWIFYSFCIIIFFKIFYNNIFFIYRSHSIEYEIRKKNSNLIIVLLTRFCEKIVYQLSDIATSVSSIEKKKVYKYYNKRTVIFPNSIRTEDLINTRAIKSRNIPRKFILFSGSYDYKPNKEAINYIAQKIIPIISLRGISFVMTGGCDVKFNSKYIYNFGCISKSKLKYLYQKSICLIVPIFEGYGTRIKILEALTLGTNILTTTKGIEGINYSNKSSKIIIANNLREMVKGISYFSNKKNKVVKKIDTLYSMKINASSFFKKIKSTLYS